MYEEILRLHPKRYNFLDYLTDYTSSGVIYLPVCACMPTTIVRSNANKNVFFIVLMSVM